MAKDRRCLDGQSYEVAEMASAETVMAVYSDRGKRGLPLEGVYRQLYSRDLYLRAYGRIHRNDGAMTPGVTAETVDAMSLEKIDGIIGTLRREAYRWPPARRTYIRKKDGKKRPLGLPTWSSKLVQEALRLLLDAYYEPRFSDHSHGFRQGRGCHTALREITQRWRGVKWFIEGDIKGCFDNICHEVLLETLSETVQDNRLLRLVSNMLKAGYMEDWRYNDTVSGTPQGGVISPILSNIYLDKLDRFVEENLLPIYNRGNRRRNDPRYKAIINAARRAGDRGNHEEAARLRKQAQAMPSRDPEDPDFRRLWYVRYADDWLLGFSGPRHEAEEIKRRIGQFLRETLRLELSEAKTLITHARHHAARFLGYEVVALHADEKHDQRGQRIINGLVRLNVPNNVIVKQCRRYMRDGKAVHRPERLHDADFSIVSQYGAEYRGFVQYYLLAFNAHRLWRVHQVMRTSLLGTLANKHKTKIAPIYRRLRMEVEDRGRTQTALVVTRERGEGQKPLVAMFGGISLAWKEDAILSDRPPRVYSGVRSEVVQRLLAQKCEHCGSEEGPFEVHHVRRLADLDRPGRNDQPLWVKRMASRRRKTLVVCTRCHQDIHRDRSGWRERIRHWKAG
jgi:group II intron reverse transcriptase/maturase